MAPVLPQRSPGLSHGPHANRLALLAAILGIIGMPLGPLLWPSLAALILGLIALVRARDTLPEFHARPEAYLAITSGILGLLFGLLQRNLLMHP